MRAAWYERNGAAREVLTLGERATPAPAAGEVLVRVHASGVNPSDVKTRAGTRGGMAFPLIIPHSDGAGVVAGVGAGVDGGRVGQRVWLWNAAWRRPHGTCAEYIALPADQAVPLPDGVTFAEGACLGIPASTACHAVLGDGPVAGQTILVTGGAGAVGHYAIQFARRGCARVIATVSGPAKADQARAAGADIVLDYRRQDVAAELLALTGGAGVDRIVEVEFGGNLAASAQVLAQGGTIAAYGSMAEPEPRLPFYPLMYRHARLHFLIVYLLAPAERARVLAHLAEALAEGALRHRVAARFPLTEVAAAHEAVETGQIVGNVVVTLD